MQDRLIWIEHHKKGVPGAVLACNQIGPAQIPLLAINVLLPEVFSDIRVTSMTLSKAKNQ